MNTKIKVGEFEQLFYLISTTEAVQIILRYLFLAVIKANIKPPEQKISSFLL